MSLIVKDQSASTSLVGGKAHNLLRLAAQSLAVPPFLVLSTAAFETAVQSCSEAAQLLARLREDPPALHILARMRELVLRLAVPPEVVEAVAAFIAGHDAAASFAVRSSGISEDGASAAFAGQYSTLINCVGPDQVQQGIRECWASQFVDAVWLYAAKLGVPDKVGMGVVVQLQIDSAVAGVAFSVDPTKANRTDIVVVEASFGQGEAVVGGAVAPDRFEVSRADSAVVGREISTKHTKFVLKQEGGLQQVPVDESLRNVACLTDEQLLQVSKLAISVEASRDNRPVDIEFAFDGAQKLYLLQARDVTVTADSKKIIAWTPPTGCASCVADPVHLPKPCTTLSLAPIIAGMSRGFEESARKVGSLLWLRYHSVRNVFYEEFINPKPEEFPDFFATAATYYNERKWVQEFEDWTNRIVPEKNARHLELKKVDLSKLSDQELIAHFRVVMKNWEDSFYGHHTHTLTLCTGQGHFVFRSEQLTGQPDHVLLALLQGSAPKSRGIWIPEEAEKLKRAFAENEQARQMLSSFDESAGGRRAGDILDQLRNSVPAVQAWLDRFDHYTLGSYDASQPTFGEAPAIVLQNFKSVVFAGQGDIAAAATATSAKKAAELKAKIMSSMSDEAARAEFEALLADTIRQADLRDERGLINDVQASGLVRIVLREIGERIIKQRPDFIPSWEFLLDCDETEIGVLLLGASEGAPSSETIQERRIWRLTANPATFPPFLGTPPQPPPDFDQLPPGVREAEKSRFSFLRNILPEIPQESGEGAIKGKCGNPGTLTGIARVLLDTASWSKLQPGDIAVLPSTNCAFNACMPLVGAVVTDFGGTLSHAAVCAREFGIPAVVGTFTATAKIPDGAKILVDGTNGTVTVLKH